MSPLNVLTIAKNQFYYICGNRTALIIRSDDRIDFNADKLLLSQVAHKYNIIVEDIKDVYMAYGGVDNYLKREWGLDPKIPGTPSYDQTMFMLEPINVD